MGRLELMRPKADNLFFVFLVQIIGSQVWGVQPPLLGMTTDGLGLDQGWPIYLVHSFGELTVFFTIYIRNYMNNHKRLHLTIWLRYFAYSGLVD